MSIAGKTLAETEPDVDLTIGPLEGDTIPVDGGGPDGYDWDMISYLGDNFTGSGYAACVSSTYSVKYALWQQADAVEATDQLDETTQRNNAKNEGTIIGCYPLLAEDE